MVKVLGSPLIHLLKVIPTFEALDVRSLPSHVLSYWIRRPHYVLRLVLVENASMLRLLFFAWCPETRGPGTGETMKGSSPPLPFFWLLSTGLEHTLRRV
jgi:hypothetical protein